MWPRGEAWKLNRLYRKKKLMVRLMYNYYYTMPFTYLNIFIILNIKMLFYELHKYIYKRGFIHIKMIKNPSKVTYCQSSLPLILSKKFRIRHKMGFA